MNMNNGILHIEQLCKKYGTKHVLKDLSLSVPKGSVFGLLGKNGEGKTTLIKSLLGLIKPDSGSLLTLGKDPWNLDDSIKERIGYVPQMDRVYPWLTVQQLIEYTASFYKHWNMPLVQKLVREWELNPADKVGLLSEGQVQKLLIILSLGHEPELLIFDEPVASLDPAARRKFLKTILDIVANRTCTIFFSTHITSDLERVADRVALLKYGKIDFCGELDDLKDEVKRLRVSAKESTLNGVDFEGLLHYELLKNEAVFSVRGYNPEMKARIEKTWNAHVDVEDLNLEEIFLELNR